MNMNNADEKEIVTDNELIGLALKGNKRALENLIIRYKNWIFNIAIRMVISPSDAEDVTQEIIIKLLTHLDKYDGNKASFKTWLYRITVNHILNMKKRGFEKSVCSFDNFYERMDYIKDIEPGNTKEISDLIKDTMINCVMATLVCLDRFQRLVIILGVIFDTDSKTGAEILDITPSNFRQILSRSRKKLKRFMSATCSLVNPKAKCRCRMKITDLISRGFRDPEKLCYSKLKYDKTVREVLGKKVSLFFEKYFDRFNHVFKNQPFWESPEMTRWLGEAIESKEFKDIFYL